MKEFVEYVAKSLVEDPSAVEVTSLDDGRLLQLRVDDADRGKVIGKRGRTAHAIRTLLVAVSEDENNPVSLDIVD